MGKFSMFEAALAGSATYGVCLLYRAGSTASLPAGVLKSSHTSGQMTADSNLLRSFGQTSIHMSRDREVAKVLKKVFDKSEKG